MTTGTQNTVIITYFFTVTDIKMQDVIIELRLRLYYSLSKLGKACSSAPGDAALAFKPPFKHPSSIFTGIVASPLFPSVGI